jgi:hypothetical protein
MFRFWYRFIPKNITNIESGLGEQVLKTRVMPDISDYLGRIFEDICKEYLIRRNIEMTLPFMFNTIGRWWGTNPQTKSQEEIDILAVYQENAIFGECKWKNESLGLSVLNELIRRSEILKKYRNSSYMLFSKAGFTEELIIEAQTRDNVELIDLNTLFKN